MGQLYLLSKIFIENIAGGIVAEYAAADFILGFLCSRGNRAY
jgi:hypothetical protein